MKTKSGRVGVVRVLGVLGVWAFCHGAQARQWTNDQGKTIEAEYVSSDGKSVVLKINGKQVNYELSRLSEADREFVGTQVKEAPKPRKPAGFATFRFHPPLPTPKTI